MYENIPEELRALPQWVTVDMSINPATGMPKKWPMNPHTLTLASVNQPSTWGTFEAAVNARGPHIGFVFTAGDPYAFIDLDPPEKMREKGGQEAVNKATDLNKKIYAAFDSYSELSQSGNGVHIICRGNTPTGHRRDTIELYTAQRFAIFTGNVIRPSPIVEYQELITLLWQEMGGDNNGVDLASTSRPSNLSDSELINLGLRAKNGEKFAALCRGDWKDCYSTQSEADFGLMSMLCFYSPDNEQCLRVFRMTELGQRPKATKDDTGVGHALPYLRRTLLNIRLRELPTVDFAKLVVPDFKPPAPIVAPPPPVMRTALEPTPPVLPYRPPAFAFPEGVLGEVAAYILGQAILPVPELALVGAIAFCAGIVGRAYNISGTGLNHYLVFVALTGTGKEAAADGIDKLITNIRPRMPNIEQFFGPGVFASGQALVRVLDTRPCFLSVLGEFGHTLQTWSDPRQAGPVQRIRQVLLDCYGKSGSGQLLYPSVYSDSDKNTKLIQSPCISIFGQATPETFYDGLTLDQVAEGLIPRFTVVEYTGERTSRNQNRQHIPSPELITKICAFTQASMYAGSNHATAKIEVTPDAQFLFDAFDELADSRIRGKSEADRQLWNRAHLKALKLAGLLAATDNPDAPQVTQYHASYAITFIEREIEAMCTRFVEQRYGRDESRFESIIRDAVESYFHMDDATKIETYKVPSQLLSQPIVPFGYLRRRLKRVAAFTADKRGVALAIRLALQDLVDGGVLAMIPPLVARNQYGADTALYTVGQGW